MFPYPSGEGLHVGHVRIFTACDVMARYYRMKGHEVLSPMGWDAFGLPAENAAIKAKKIPQEMVPKNYANFKKQMQNLSLDFDWERELATTDPEYYAITQWIFLQLYKKGLVYREKVAINWCPKCKTGLANEEVVNGRHERCGTLVEKKQLKQWLLAITKYADRLIEGLKDVDYPSRIADQQGNLEKNGLPSRFVQFFCKTPGQCTLSDQGAAEHGGRFPVKQVIAEIFNQAQPAWKRGRGHGEILTHLHCLSNDKERPIRALIRGGGRDQRRPLTSLSNPGRIASKKAFRIRRTTTSHALDCGFSTFPERSAWVATSPRGRFSNSFEMPPTSPSYNFRKSFLSLS